MVSDPYMILGLNHDASPNEIKRAYRSLAMKLHPDRLMCRGASQVEIQASSTKFATVTSAYSLLSDSARKRQYDHIYKYGGCDDPGSSTSPAPRPTYKSNSPMKRPQKGIGYTFTDPVAYLLSQGRVKSQAVAGISIPSRFGMGHPTSGDFRVAVSSGKAHEAESGSLHIRSTTMQFSGGKKFNKVETTTIHRDGRKEVLIQGDDYVERRFSTAKRRRPRTLQEKIGFGNNLASAGDDTPWHAQFFKDISSNIQRCTNPSLCGAISVQ